MRVSLRTLIPLLTLIAACAPATGGAQAAAQQPQPEMRYMTVTKFQLPEDAEQRRLVLMAMDSVMVPVARMDPNVLSYRVVTHAWGANSNDILVIAEYANWAAIEAPCPECDRWLEARLPPEGTPDRERWDAMGAAFQRAYAGHSDEIFAAPRARAKN